MKINKKILSKFNPCSDRWQNYLNHYSDFEGSLYEFLCLDKISIEDKHWAITQEWECKKFQRLQRDFALVCADRATFDSTEEIKEFFLLCAFMNISEMFELTSSDEYWSADRSVHWSIERSTERSADRSAYWSAYWSAYRSADRSAYWSANWSAYWSACRSAYWSANWSTYWSAERELQIEIFKSLVKDQDE